jgi:hypothetical protein
LPGCENSPPNKTNTEAPKGCKLASQIRWYPLIFKISAGPGFLKKIKLRELHGSGCLKIEN